MDNLRLWHKALENIKQEVLPATFRTFFLKTTLKEVGEDKVILSTPSAFTKEALIQKHFSLLEAVFEKLLGKKMALEIRVKESEITETSDENFFQPIQIQTSSLNPKYTLENFVVGPTNNIAYAAALAVTQNPGTSYNPLFIYGGTGVGKTHLMLGIGNAVLKKNSHFKVTYCSSEKFTNDYVEAIQNRQMGTLRNRYRSVDILLIDDIQFFSGREGTQEEFFHTFNELSTRNAQIVITSDRPPHEIAKLEDRLKSRFQGGLMVDIQLPDFDTRVAILKAKCAERGESVPEECLKLIAELTQTNARELEGRMIQILQNLKIQQKEATLDNIKPLLGQKAVNLTAINYKQVLSTICEYFNVKLSELTGPRRVKGLVLPRHIAMHILSEDLNLTVEKIGEVMGGRDHTTVMHGRDKVKKLAVGDSGVRKILGELKQNLSTL